MFDCSGKTALVTGSSQGIGKEIAKVLSDAGATVFVHGRERTEKLEKAAEYVGTTKIALGDCACHDIADKLFEQTGGVDILVLNASYQVSNSWDRFSEEDFDRQISCNLRSSYFIIKRYIDYMKEKQWGRIVTLGSVNQYNNHPKLSLYGVTKAAQFKMVESIAPHIAPYGVTINNLAPGAIATPRNAEVLSNDSQKSMVISKIPAGYVGEPQDVAGAALLLCSDAGRYITGSEILVDGGMHL